MLVKCYHPAMCVQEVVRLTVCREKGDFAKADYYQLSLRTQHILEKNLFFPDRVAPEIFFWVIAI